MKDLSEYIARCIFEAGDSDGLGKTDRIAFMIKREGGEVTSGGYCESALAAAIRSAIDQYAIDKLGGAK